MEILVDGKVQELTAVGNTDQTEDLLGNYDALHYDSESGMYTMSQEDFEWWQPMVEKLNKIHELENALTPEDKEKYYQTDELFDPDLERDTDLKIGWLQEHFAEIKYELLEYHQEVAYRDRKEIKEGCTLNPDKDQNPQTLKSFDSKEDALNALNDYKSEVNKMNGYFLVTEFFVEEVRLDGDKDELGRDILATSEMPITEIVKANPEIAESERISASDLKILSEECNFDFNTCFRVADNPNTPVDALEALAKNKNFQVRIAVAENRNTSAATLETLAKDEAVEVRMAVADNKNTLAATLEALAKDGNPDVRRSVADNKNTPAATLEALAKDEDPDVRMEVAWNLHTPAAALEALAKDEAVEVRMAVEDNKNMLTAEALFKGEKTISASDLKEAKAEKDAREVNEPKQEHQKQKAQDQEIV